MSKLPITVMTTTNTFNDLLMYSIKSIYEYVNEILILDDSDQINDYNEYSKMTNVKFLKLEYLSKNLGTKKNFLLDNATNDIVIRWDNDFILCNSNVLTECYNILKTEKYNGVITFNHNIAYDLSYLNKKQPFVSECYIFNKKLYRFQKHGNYMDYPVEQIKGKYCYLKKCLFIHMSNFKSYEQLVYRNMMNSYMCSDYSNYFHYLFRLNDNNKYKNNILFNEIIKFKQKKIKCQKEIVHSFDTIIKDNTNISNSLSPNFKNFINNNFRILNIDNKTFNFITNDTDKITNLFYWGGKYDTGNFGDILSYYIFEKLTGYKHNYHEIINVDNSKISPHYMTIGSIINYSTPKTIIWGSGVIHRNLKNIEYKKITCVRGPQTYKILKKKGYDINDKYGDPALLTPIIYNPTHITKKYELGIIPHIIDYDFINNIINDKNIFVINLNINKKDNNIENVINQINSCKFIISSSLHGVILSNAYNIPVVRFKNKKLAGDDIKFIDYFESVYSDKYICDTTLDIQSIIGNIDTIKQIYKEPDLIENRQNDLIETCPFIDNTLRHLLITTTKKEK